MPKETLQDWSALYLVVKSQLSEDDNTKDDCYSQDCIIDPFDLDKFLNFSAKQIHEGYFDAALENFFVVPNAIEPF